MSDGPANGIKIPHPLSRESSLPNRNHLTPQIAAAPAEQGQFPSIVKRFARPVRHDVVCVRRSGPRRPIRSIATPNLINHPACISRVFGKWPRRTQPLLQALAIHAIDHCRRFRTTDDPSSTCVECPL
jgi:hypothetical protein